MMKDDMSISIYNKGHLPKPYDIPENAIIEIRNNRYGICWSLAAYAALPPAYKRYVKGEYLEFMNMGFSNTFCRQIDSIKAIEADTAELVK